MDATKLQDQQDRFERTLKEAGLDWWVKSEAFFSSDGVFTADQKNDFRALAETRAGRRIIRSIRHEAKQLRILEARHRRNENARWKRS